MWYQFTLKNKQTNKQTKNNNKKNPFIFSVLKGHWTSIASSSNFFQKSWDFYTIGSVGMSNDCMLSFMF